MWLMGLLFHNEIIIQSYTMLLSVKGTQVCINSQQFNSQKEILIFLTLNNNCFAQIILLIRTVSQVSDVAYWSLFLNKWNIHNLHSLILGPGPFSKKKKI